MSADTNVQDALFEVPESPAPEQPVIDPSPVAAPQPEAFPLEEEAPVAAPSQPLIQPVEPRSETERIDPIPLEMVLLSGTEFSLEPLKLRQFLRLLRIVTRGASGILSQIDLDFDDPQAFVQNFLGMVLFAVPEAEEESIDFIKSMVLPKNLSTDSKQSTKQMRELNAELDNPELEDVVTIMQAVVENEAEDLRALGKRLASMFQTAQKLGVTSGLPQSAT